MKRKIYFCGSIRGGRDDVSIYHDIISFLNQNDIVLTEQVGDNTHSLVSTSLSYDQTIYQKDTNWLKECDIVIAECTTPSLGVGYELAYAERYQKPVHILYRGDIKTLSAMLVGNPYFTIHTYQDKDELFSILKSI